VGETLYYGPGAGGDATASAVVANIIDIARAGKKAPMLGFDKPLEGELRLKATDDINSKYYLRINVSDRTGVLAKITKIFENHNISVETMLQRPSSESSANLLISTHIALEKDIQDMIKELNSLDFIKADTVMIRIV
jgi:homoserine dehydrogenase